MDTTEKTQRTYGEREEVAGLQRCMKRQVVVHAKKMSEPFRVDTLEGNYKQGQPGDYLMRGVDGEIYICNGEIFERTYDFL
jgi:hypothetical protein